MPATDNPQVSIIICFYNEQDYLERCLLSIHHQSYKNIQVVLINDGSTDASQSIAESFVQKFKNAFVHTTANKGLGHARNAGLKHVTGEYLTFLDADDELEPAMIEACVKEMNRSSADMVVCRFSVYGQDNTNYITNGWREINGLPLHAGMAAQAVYSYKVASTVWAKMYRSSVAKQLKFPEGIWFEDRPYLLDYIANIQWVAFIPESLLKIHNRSTSITRRLLSARRIIDAQKVFEEELKVTGRYIHFKFLQPFIARHQLHSMFDSLILLYMEPLDKKEYRILKDTFLTQTNALKSVVAKNKINFNLKDRLNLLFLSLPGLVSHSIAKKIIFTLKKSRVASIRKLKN